MLQFVSLSLGLSSLTLGLDRRGEVVFDFATLYCDIRVLSQQDTLVSSRRSRNRFLPLLRFLLLRSFCFRSRFIPLR